MTWEAEATGPRRAVRERCPPPGTVPPRFPNRWPRRSRRGRCRSTSSAETVTELVVRPPVRSGGWSAGRCTRRPATTARPGCSTAGGCPRTPSCRRRTAASTRPRPCSGWPGPTPSASSTGMLVAVMQDLWVLMAELATLPENRDKLDAGTTAVTQEMVDRLEATSTTSTSSSTRRPSSSCPAATSPSAWLDLARTVVRRAERHSLAAAEPPSLVVPYLNRLSDLLWTMARWQDAADGSTLRVRDVGDRRADCTCHDLPDRAPSPRFNPTPSIERSGDVVVAVARAVPDDGRRGRRAGRRRRAPVPRQLGLDRATLVGVRLRRQGRPDARRAAPRRADARRRRRRRSRRARRRPRCATPRPRSPAPPPSTAPLATTLAEVGGRRRRASPGRSSSRASCSPATATAR